MSLERVETFYNMSVDQFKIYASNILSYKRGPLFSADIVVKELYQNKRFKFY